MTKPIYALRNVVQVYAGREVLRVEHLDIEEGIIIGVSGHNGSGKSTLLAILAFLESPTCGTVCYQGEICSPRTPCLRREVTLLTQEPYLLKRSVGANVAYGLRMRGEKSVERKVREALCLVGLEPDLFLSRSWRELSGGEAQRVALAARMVLGPRVLLLDEPTSNLDPESAELIHSAALAARDRGTTLVVVSHDMNWLKSVCDTVVTLQAGIIVHKHDVS